MRRFLLTLLLLPFLASAQDYSMQNGQDITITTCTGNVYDDGGAVADYGVGEVSSITIAPDQPGKVVQLRLESIGFSIDAFFNVYAGGSTDSPLSFTEEDPYLFSGYDYFGNPDDEGAITLEIDAVDGNASFTDDGFHFSISCVDVYPDLDIYYQSFNINSDTLVAGTPMMVNKVKRIDNGFSDAVAFYKEKLVFSNDKTWSEDDEVLDSSYTSSTSSSSNEEFAIDYQLAEGWYYMLGKLDVDEVVPETDEANNIKIDSIYLKEANPDLAVVDVVLTKDTINPGEGDDLEWEVFVENKGNLRVFTNSTYYLSTDSVVPTTQEGSNTFQTTAKNYEIGEVTSDQGDVFSWNLDDLIKGEKYYLIIHADEYGENVDKWGIEGKYIEEDEENNWYIKPFWIYAIPDTTYPMPSTGTKTLVSCDTVISDAGGINNGEQVGNNGVLILEPDDANKKVVLEFKSLDYSFFHDLYWYDGNSTSGDRLGITSIPSESLVSSDPSGAITLEADASSEFGDSDGFVAVVSCENKEVTSTNSFEQSNELMAYPNPTKNRLNITKKASSITLYDVLGNEVMQEFNTSHIDISVLPVGPYILEIENLEGITTTRVIKQ